MNECHGEKFILNGKIESSDSFSNALVYEGDSVYEVIRMVKGLPVFFYDHMERLESSTKLQGKVLLADRDTIRKNIIKLSRSDRRKEINLKIVFNYNGNRENYLVYYIEPTYPSAEHYVKGVKGILYHAERKNPRSKVINHKLRSSIFHKLILEGAYEALLVNEEGQVTEGSRTNIFFLKNNILVTAPDKYILNGITRKHILEICKENKIKVKQECVMADRISDYEAVFMTGTSPMVLPFSSVDDNSFDVKNEIIVKLRHLHLQKVAESIRQFRSV